MHYVSFKYLFTLQDSSRNVLNDVILQDGIIEDIQDYFQIEDSHFEGFYTKRFK